MIRRVWVSSIEVVQKWGGSCCYSWKRVRVEVLFTTWRFWFNNDKGSRSRRLDVRSQGRYCMTYYVGTTCQAQHFNCHDKYNPCFETFISVSSQDYHFQMLICRRRNSGMLLECGVQVLGVQCWYTRCLLFILCTLISSTYLRFEVVLPPKSRLTFSTANLGAYDMSPAMLPTPKLCIVVHMTLHVGKGHKWLLRVILVIVLASEIRISTSLRAGGMLV